MGMLNEHKMSYQDWLQANPQLLKEDRSEDDLEKAYEKYLRDYDLNTD